MQRAISPSISYPKNHPLYFKHFQTKSIKEKKTICSIGINTPKREKIHGEKYIFTVIEFSALVRNIKVLN